MAVYSRCFCFLAFLVIVPIVSYVDCYTKSVTSQRQVLHRNEKCYIATKSVTSQRKVLHRNELLHSNEKCFIATNCYIATKSVTSQRTVTSQRNVLHRNELLHSNEKCYIATNCYIATKNVASRRGLRCRRLTALCACLVAVTSRAMTPRRRHGGAGAARAADCVTCSWGVGRCSPHAGRTDRLVSPPGGDFPTW